MKVYTKIILDKNDKVIYEEYYNFEGSWGRLGIHYDYKSTRGAKAMEKKARREKKLAERRARRAKSGDKKEEGTPNKIKVDEPLSLDFITNPHKDK
jgi:hypothetical protein|tara:strand:- start:603 stop:890 length:288 start_codon:yes stop_codon:yes gene_type:complete